MLQSYVFFVWNLCVFLDFDMFVVFRQTGESRTAARNRRKRSRKADCTECASIAAAIGGQTPLENYDAEVRPPTRRQRSEAATSRNLAILEDLLAPPDTEAGAGAAGQDAGAAGQDAGAGGAAGCGG